MIAAATTTRAGMATVWPFGAGRVLARDRFWAGAWGQAPANALTRMASTSAERCTSASSISAPQLRSQFGDACGGHPGSVPTPGGTARRRSAGRPCRSAITTPDAVRPVTTISGGRPLVDGQRVIARRENGDGSPARTPSVVTTSLVLPCNNSGARTIGAPKTAPMAWWPRQHPNSGSAVDARPARRASYCRLGGRARARRDQHTVNRARQVGGYLVVAAHHDIRTELAQVLDQVVDEAVVVVDDEDRVRLGALTLLRAP